jgi:hypothetical protein
MFFIFSLAFTRLPPTLWVCFFRQYLTLLWNIIQLLTLIPCLTWLFSWHQPSISKIIIILMMISVWCRTLTNYIHNTPTLNTCPHPPYYLLVISVHELSCLKCSSIPFKHLLNFFNQLLSLPLFSTHKRISYIVALNIRQIVIYWVLHSTSLERRHLPIVSFLYSALVHHWTRLFWSAWLLKLLVLDFLY